MTRTYPCQYDFESVSKDEHRIFVQKVQRDLESWPLQSRLLTETQRDNSLHGQFEVYWDGLWHVLAIERNAMTPEATHAVNEWLWIVIQADAARSLMT